MINMKIEKRWDEEDHIKWWEIIGISLVMTLFSFLILLLIFFPISYSWYADHTPFGDYTSYNIPIGENNYYMILIFVTALTYIIPLTIIALIIWFLIFLISEFKEIYKITK